MSKISIETFNENTRNDSFIVIDKNKENMILVSYITNLCEEVNKAFPLNLDYKGEKLKNHKQFKKFVNELEEEGYYIFQLTRL